MKKNNSKVNVVINSILCGICIGAMFSLPMIILAFQFGLSLPLCMVIPMAFFGTVIPVSTVS